MLTSSAIAMETRAAQRTRNKVNKASFAKAVAENMFTARDILGAMKYALMARNLFHDLEGITQMVSTFRVYVSALNRKNGETDWYDILLVDPLADDDKVRKQYENLALKLHPDKNKSIGADGALKLVSQAWSVLSDKAKRAAYDEKMNIMSCKLSTECDPPAQSEANCDDNFTKSNTFWTFCHQCGVHYRYFRVCVNHRLVCHNCCEAFWAKEIGRPVMPIYRTSAARKYFENRKTINQVVLGENDFHWGPLSRTYGISSASQAAKLSELRLASERAKRKRNEAQGTEREDALQREHRVSEGYFNPSKIRKALEDMSLSSHGKAHVNRLEAGNGVTETTGYAKDSYKEACQNLRNLHTEAAVGEICMKLKELKADTRDQNNIGKKSEGRLSGSQATKPFASTTIADMVTKSLEKMSIDVPVVKEVANDEVKDANGEDQEKLGKEKKAQR